MAVVNLAGPSAVAVDYSGVVSTFSATPLLRAKGRRVLAGTIRATCGRSGVPLVQEVVKVASHQQLDTP
eukprot:718375-Lingulodinium_polyedra.AAC.1